MKNEKHYDYNGNRFWMNDGELLVSSTKQKEDAVELWTLFTSMTCSLSEQEVENIESKFN